FLHLYFFLLQPGSVLLQPAQTLSISCRVSGYSLTDSSYATGWIRQRQGKLEWIFHQWSDGSLNRNNALKDRFSVSRDTSAGTVTIQGQRLQPDDSAVYYWFLNWCVAEIWHCDNYYFDYWGKGTQVTVTSATSTPPSVFMLAPLKHSRDNKVTLTCFVKDFNPEEIYVKWLVNDQPTMYDFNTTNSVRSNGAYYVYSHLTVPLLKLCSLHVFFFLFFVLLCFEPSNTKQNQNVHTTMQYVNSCQ
uniref:Ig-like domain-containing protein n=1 Tax=Neogobius melanostomus TaxID=47308 RepID=A0A8C6WYX4_9GOBI